MGELTIRRARDSDLPAINKLLYEVHKVHSDARPDLFKAGAKKYTDEELRAIIAEDRTPVFVAEREGRVVGYAFCIHQQYVHHNNMTDIKTLYIDDLCVDEGARGCGIGHKLLARVEDFAAECGAYNLTLHVYEGNDSAEKFYLSAGMGVQYLALEKIIKR